jgi:hypothetical protein
MHVQLRNQYEWTVWMNVCESGVQVTECARKTRVETMRGSWAGTPGPSSPSSVSSASCVCLSEREKERERERERLKEKEGQSSASRYS